MRKILYHIDRYVILFGKLIIEHPRITLLSALFIIFTLFHSHHHVDSSVENKTTSITSNEQIIDPQTVSNVKKAQPQRKKIQNALKKLIERNKTVNVTVEEGDSLASIFKHLKISAKTLQAIVELGKTTKPLKMLKPDDNLVIVLSSVTNELISLNYDFSISKTMVVECEDGSCQADQIDREIETRIAFAEGEITSSLYAAAQKAALPDSITLALAKLFGWEIDFVKDIREGDSFEIAYEEKFIDDDKIGSGKIVAAVFHHNKRDYTAVYYTDPKGHSGYYTPEGRSMQKRFLRTPVKYSRISDYFTNKRYHPILHKFRSHKGVDYAAPSGTPIKAAGSGKIYQIGRHGGYGNAITIAHGSGYSTLYGHMSHFAKHLKVGSKVEQGQVIGYVGMTGLATGPHLHYEFRINGKQHDPLKVKLPKGNAISNAYKKDFATKSSAVLTKLHNYHSTQLATSTPE